MAIPSGSGSEVLRNAAVDSNNAATAKIDFGGTTGTGSVRTSGNTAGVVAVPANVIITVLTINCTSNSGSQNINCKVDWQGGGTSVTIFNHNGLAEGTTFVYNDKIVLREGDVLTVFNHASNCDWNVHFIYQDWT
tara:strand:- start:196 stop:600 length:405 start_codon:yes stop_codon:yes gene_type:complete